MSKCLCRIRFVRLFPYIYINTYYFNCGSNIVAQRIEPNWNSNKHFFRFVWVYVPVFCFFSGSFLSLFANSLWLLNVAAALTLWLCPYSLHESCTHNARKREKTKSLYLPINICILSAFSNIRNRPALRHIYSMFVSYRCDFRIRKCFRVSELVVFDINVQYEQHTHTHTGAQRQTDTHTHTKREMVRERERDTYTNAISIYSVRHIMVSSAKIQVNIHNYLYKKNKK